MKAPSLTRRARRRLFVLGTVAVVGASVPFWLPRFLAAVPAFEVERVGVVGTRFIPPDEVVRLAAISPDASVWDDPAVWERRVESHPMVRRARIHRTGMRSLEIRVLEERPVALAATPALVAVNAEGRILPLDPTAEALDLPLLRGLAEVTERGWLARPEHRRLAALLEALEAHDPAFVRMISDLTVLPGDGVKFRMLESAPAEQVLLPVADPVRALRRVGLALGHAESEWVAAAGDEHPGPLRVVLADARFEGQVVLRKAPRPDARLDGQVAIR